MHIINSHIEQEGLPTSLSLDIGQILPRTDSFGNFLRRPYLALRSIYIQTVIIPSSLLQALGDFHLFEVCICMPL
jgi:hypothetical protein